MSVLVEVERLRPLGWHIYVVRLFHMLLVIYHGIHLHQLLAWWSPLFTIALQLNLISLVSIVIISFPLEETPDVSMIAWTTTPWTLPSNLALVVNANLQYVKVKGEIFLHLMVFAISTQLPPHRTIFNRVHIELKSAILLCKASKLQKKIPAFLHCFICGN